MLKYLIVTTEFDIYYDEKAEKISFMLT